MWPKYEEFKKELEEWLGECHPIYLQEVNYREWNNYFSVKHCSSVIIINYKLIIDVRKLILYLSNS